LCLLCWGWIIPSPFYIIKIMRDILDELAEGAVILDGFDSCIIGITEEFGNGPRILYSKDKILKVLMDEHEMTFEDALEYYDFNILGLYAGEQNPVFFSTELH
jgi:hypothetical protein